MEYELQKNSMKPLSKKFTYDEDDSRKQTELGEMSESSIMKPSFDYSKNMTEGISSENSSKDGNVEFKADARKKKSKMIVFGGIALFVVVLAVLLVIFLKPKPEESSDGPEILEAEAESQEPIVF